MNCHRNNNEKNRTYNHSLLRHMLHMILCCGLPILILATLPFVSSVSPSVSRILAVIAPFICPILMIGMISMMLGGGRNNKKSSCCESKEDNSSAQLELNKPTE